MDSGSEPKTHNTPPPRFLRFMGEMGRRRVWRAALAYGAVVFVLLQVGEIVFPAFGAPDWALRILVYTSFLCFPPVLCLTWVFDITSKGIVFSDRNGGLPGSGNALPRIALLAVTLSMVGGVGWWTVQDTIKNEVGAAPRASDGTLIPAATGSSSRTVSSLAVLPLDDFSEEEGGEFFTAGLHEELISQLSQIEEARVVSRTSVVQYDRSGKTMPFIASDLGVDGVVEGSVFRAGNRVRITVQLIHGPSDTHLWANSYEGTLDDVIALQSQVAQDIVREIRQEFFDLDEDKSVTTRVAAVDPEAEEEYFRGRRAQVLGTAESLDSAVQYYERALDTDSSYMAAELGLRQVQFMKDSYAGGPREMSPHREVRQARRLAASSHFAEAEEVLLNVVAQAPDSEEAWGALEHIKTIRGDIPGVIEVRIDRQSGTLGNVHDSAALVRLQGLFEERGEEGYWNWKMEEMDALVTEGHEVSQVDLARAYVGIGNLDQALTYLEGAIEEQDRKLVSLWTDRAWTSLRADPRFRAILSQLRGMRSNGRFPMPDWPEPGV